MIVIFRNLIDNVFIQGFSEFADNVFTGIKFQYAEEILGNFAVKIAVHDAACEIFVVKRKCGQKTEFIEEIADPDIAVVFNAGLSVIGDHEVLKDKFITDERQQAIRFSDSVLIRIMGR